MSDDPRLLSVDEYRARVLAAVSPAAPARTALRECLGLVLTEDVTSQISLPSFDNSSMDGYAVRAADVGSAGADNPVRLSVAGESAAGGVVPDEVRPGTAAKIMTGAAMPPGADAVVPYEWTDRGTATVSITQAPAVGQHVRRVGEDIVAGTQVLAAGTVLGPRQVSLLAAVGRAEVLVHPRPRVAVVSTGTELRNPGEALGPTGLYDSNSTLLASCVERAGAVVTYTGHVSDAPQDFLALVESLDADIVITSGGISMGDYDIVKETLAPRGLWFGRVAMQPGKPQGFGRVNDRTLLIAMPGNPVSTFVSFHQFVLPALRRLMGHTHETEAPGSAILSHSLTSPPGRRQFLRGRRCDDGSVAQVGGAGSHLLGGLAGADCLIVIDEETRQASAGETVTVIDLAGF
jgi:molybdopterin molybdotransferase